MQVLLSYSIHGTILDVRAKGDWTLRNISAATARALSRRQKEIINAIRSQRLENIQLNYRPFPNQKALWGSFLLSFFCQLREEAQKKSVSFDISSLPLQMQELLAVSYTPAVTGRQQTNTNLFNILGAWVEKKFRQVLAAMDFVGEISLALLKFFAGKAAISSKDVWQEIYNAGASSLPIISLVSVLLGLILAFVSAVQLQVLGAEIYVSSLITVSMVRVMSPVLTGIVIAGRIGASYAATIGSMQVNEEVDALKTFGINPIEFLVLPRFLALTLMMPFLTVYADFMGIFGGYAVIYLGWDISFYAFLNNVQTFTHMHHIIIGLFHSFVFGILIAISGCYQGMISGRDAEAVGRATTLAVVHSIIGIIVSTSVITIILSGFKL